MTVKKRNKLFLGLAGLNLLAIIFYYSPISLIGYWTDAVFLLLVIVVTKLSLSKIPKTTFHLIYWYVAGLNCIVLVFNAFSLSHGIMAVDKIPEGYHTDAKTYSYFLERGNDGITSGCYGQIQLHRKLTWFPILEINYKTNDCSMIDYKFIMEHMGVQRDSTKVTVDTIRQETNTASHAQKEVETNLCETTLFVYIDSIITSGALLPEQDIALFVFELDTPCGNNSEYIEFRNEVLFKILDNYPEAFIRILHVQKEGKNYLSVTANEIENPIHDGIDLLELLRKVEKVYSPYTETSAEIEVALSKAIEKGQQ